MLALGLTGFFLKSFFLGFWTSSWALRVGAPSNVPWPIKSVSSQVKIEDIPAEANRSSIMTLLPDVGYLADTPLATNGSLRRAFNSALRPSALTVRLEDGLPLVWNGRSVSSGSDNLIVSACNHSKMGTYSEGSISTSIASAASFNQFLS